MGTWHQDQNPIPLWHETKWTVVSDPPNGCLSLMRFETGKEANDYFNNCQMRGEKHTYVIPPFINKAKLK